MWGIHFLTRLLEHYIQRFSCFSQTMPWQWQYFIEQLSESDSELLSSGEGSGE